MKIILITLFSTYFFVLACWITYIAVMNFRARRDTLHLAVKINAYVVLGIGLVLDLILTVVIGTVIFLSPPRLPHELTFTARLKRHRAGGGWRAMLAAWICEKLLNPFVADGHC